MSKPSQLEAAAIAVHDLLWENVGVSADWRLHMEGDDEIATRFIELLNELQAAIAASGYASREYDPRKRLGPLYDTLEEKEQGYCRGEEE